MASSDWYSVLGVLPDAEDVVVAAAYRALAQRYHPDKWRNDPQVAHERMAEINEAYRILRDKALRSEYDRSRAQDSQDFAAAGDEEREGAFADALDEIEQRWAVASSVFPDLVELRDRLSQISKALAFSFVSGILASKQFGERLELAGRLERAFLERYFGTNDQVIAFARRLILAGKRQAAKSLNRLVDVLGSDVDPVLLMRRIDEDFGLRAERETAAKVKAGQDRIQELAEIVRNLGYFDEARLLAELLGYSVSEVGGGIFTAPKIVVTPQGQPEDAGLTFENSKAFVTWMRKAHAQRL